MSRKQLLSDSVPAASVQLQAIVDLPSRNERSVHPKKPARARAHSLRIWIALLIAAAHVPALTRAESLCESCELQMGIGWTYHFWGSTGGLVLPLTLQWNGGRYELGLFRVSRQQILFDTRYPYGHVMADPYWGLSISRRWRLYEKGPLRLFFGFGISAKTESDQLSCTRLNFASQLGVRFRLPGDRIVGELTMRHWSNAGIRLPNHGQDFATLTFRLNTGRVGTDEGEQIAVAALRRFTGGSNVAYEEGLP